MPHMVLWECLRGKIASLSSEHVKSACTTATTLSEDACQAGAAPSFHTCSLVNLTVPLREKHNHYLCVTGGETETQRGSLGQDSPLWQSQNLITVAAEPAQAGPILFLTRPQSKFKPWTHHLRVTIVNIIHV